MKHVFLTGLTLCFALTACTNPSPSSSVEGTTAGKGIYDGEITTTDNPISHTTVFIFIEINGEAFRCTGNVLSPTVILTAAHCVTSVVEATQTTIAAQPQQVTIHNPFKFENDRNNSLLAISSKILVHPAYAASETGQTKSIFNNGYDVALIQLSQPLPEYYKPVKLSDNLEELTKNQVYVAGVGSHAIDDNATPSYLLRHGPATVDLTEHFVKVPMFGKDTPMTYLTTNLTTSPNVSFRKTGMDATVCKGDSGGPLYFVKDGEVYLAGVNVSMYNTKDIKRCAVEENAIESAVSMAGPTLGFILNSFKEITGSSLPIVRDVPEMDPNTFEFYLHTPVLTSKNNITSLEGFAFAKDGKDNSIVIIDQETAATICEKTDDTLQLPSLYILFDKTFENHLDGKTVLPIMLSHHGSIEGFVEGRAKLEGNKVKLVVHTAEGYLSAELPYKVCAAPAAATN